MTGKLVVIDGLDGSGKATQAGLLCEALKQQTLPVQRVSFPDYKSDSSALVRMYLNGELGSHPDDVNAYAASTFYAVDRYASYQREWRPFLESGGIVIADRYTTSNAIHQCAKLPKEQWDAYLDWLFDFEYRLLGLPEPALVICLHVDLAVSQGLLGGRYEGNDGRKDLHERDMAYLQRALKAAEYCAEKYGWRVMECCRNGKIRDMGEIQDEIWQVVRSSLV